MSLLPAGDVHQAQLQPGGQPQVPKAGDVTQGTTDEAEAEAFKVVMKTDLE